MLHIKDNRCLYTSSNVSRVATSLIDLPLLTGKQQGSHAKLVNQPNLSAWFRGQVALLPAVKLNLPLKVLANLAGWGKMAHAVFK